VPALKTHLERVTKSSGIQYDLDAKGLERRLPASVETALFRTSQEAIANVVRHAAADQVRIRLACDDQWFNVEIVDDGRGFDLTRVNVNGNSARGLGLLGMKERIVQCGGDLEISSRPGNGTTVCMRVPIEEMDCA
jgi:signal transduction histidine kinase